MILESRSINFACNMPAGNTVDVCDSIAGLPTNRKYPRTPYWPYAPAIGRDDSIHHEPDRFVDIPVVVTEKLDGSNSLIHQGRVYSRSVSLPCTGKCMAKVKNTTHGK